MRLRVSCLCAYKWAQPMQLCALSVVSSAVRMVMMSCTICRIVSRFIKGKRFKVQRFKRFKSSKVQKFKRFKSSRGSEYSDYSEYSDSSDSSGALHGASPSSSPYGEVRRGLLFHPVVAVGIGVGVGVSALAVAASGAVAVIDDHVAAVFARGLFVEVC